jgi:predicted PolB exonuclease-like 3'-5' exonuclease
MEIVGMNAVALAPQPVIAETNTKTGYLVFDTESVPDGVLLAQIKFPGEPLSPEAAIARAQEEARLASPTGSDFLPVSFQIPVAVCVVRVADDFTLQNFTCLDAPHYRPEEVVRRFWQGVERTYKQAKLVTFNGRGFDLPMLELAAFRLGLPLTNYLHRGRDRFHGNHLDLLELFTNRGASKLVGGLNLLAKMLGKPGKTTVVGQDVYQMHCEGRIAEINDYCLCDTLDTYFVFLRTRVLTGDLTLEQEADIIRQARALLEARSPDVPVLKEYLANWEA